MKSHMQIHANSIPEFSVIEGLKTSSTEYCTSYFLVERHQSLTQSEIEHACSCKLCTEFSVIEGLKTSSTE